MKKRIVKTRDGQVGSREQIIALITKKAVTRKDITRITGLEFENVKRHIRRLLESRQIVAKDSSNGKEKQFFIVSQDANLDNHPDEYLGRESIFHVGMAIAADVAKLGACA